MKHPHHLVFACCLAACHGVAPQLAAPNSDVSVALPTDEFPGASGMATGFDARTGDRSWQSDDEVVFALRLRKGEEVHRWLLRLRVVFGEQLVARIDNLPSQRIALWEERSWTYTVTDAGQRRDLQAKSRMLPVSAIVCDEHGKQLTKSLVKLPVQLLGRGLLPAVDTALSAARVQPGANETPQYRDESVRPLVEATLGLMSLLTVVQEDDALAEYFWQVVEKPSIWSVITGFGVKATFSMPFEKSVPATNLPPDLPAPGRAFVVPMQIDVNGSPALFLEVVATDAARPYSLCGGIVAAVARHPTNPDVTLELQLLAARLGEEDKAVKGSTRR
ncbi:MAG TPA: hypothetical protein VF384_06815 [Planctomycetota bacterium]